VTLPGTLPGDSKIPEEIFSHPVLLTSQPPPLPFRQSEGIQTFMRLRWLLPIKASALLQ